MPLRTLFVGLAIVVVIAVAALAWRGVSQEQQADLAKLRETAATAAPILRAVDRARTERGAVPRTAGDLAGLLPEGVVADDLGPVIRFDVGAPPGWLFAVSPDGQGFEMSRKIDQDARLIYSDENGQGAWQYDPGDGSDPTPVELRP